MSVLDSKVLREKFGMVRGEKPNPRPTFDHQTKPTSRSHRRKPNTECVKMHARKYQGAARPKPDDRMCLSKYLVHRLILADMGQQQLAERAGVSSATVSQIVRGDVSARPFTLDLFAQVLGEDSRAWLHYYSACRAGYVVQPPRE